MAKKDKIPNFQYLIRLSDEAILTASDDESLVSSYFEQCVFGLRYLRIWLKERKEHAKD